MIVVRRQSRRRNHMETPMLTGRTIESLAGEVMRQRASAKDFITPSGSTTMVVEPIERTADGKALPARFSLEIPGQGKVGINRLAHEQLALYSGIPLRYVDRMTQRTPDLLATNVNRWLREENTPRLARVLDGNLRAWLSDGYRPLDNVKLLEALLPVLHRVGGEVFSSEITDRRLYVQIRSPKLVGEVKVGDVVQGGLAIRNSEVGCGSLSIEFLLYRLICKNGAVMEKVMRRAHIGRKVTFGDGADDALAVERISDETRQLEDATFFSKVRDAVTDVMTQERFKNVLASAQRAAGMKIEVAPEKAVAAITREIKLNQDEGGKMLRHLIEGGDLTAWGFANAVTHVAHDVTDYDRAVELETAGGRLLNLSAAQWKRLAAQAIEPEEN